MRMKYYEVMKRTTVVLSDALYEDLRREAFLQRTSVSSVIRRRLEPVPRKSRRGTPAASDPLLRVAGIGSDGRLAEAIDEALYGE